RYMRMKSFAIATAALALCASSPQLFAEDAPQAIYRYTFELTEGRSCEGSSKLKPEDLGRALGVAGANNGFFQLEQYHTASGTDAAVGFVNPRFIVRFHLVNSASAPALDH